MDKHIFKPISFKPLPFPVPVINIFFKAWEFFRQNFCLKAKTALSHLFFLLAAKAM